MTDRVAVVIEAYGAAWLEEDAARLVCRIGLRCRKTQVLNTGCPMRNGIGRPNRDAGRAVLEWSGVGVGVKSVALR